MTGAPALATARLDLTPTGLADLDDIVALHRDPRVTAHLLDGLPDAPWKAHVYLDWAAGLHARGIGPWTARRRGNGRFLGLFTLTPFIEHDDSLLELGGRLARAGWVGDIAAEAGAALIEHAFGALGRTEIASAYHPGNPTVPAVLARLGFTDPAPATVFGRPALAMRLTEANWRGQGGRPARVSPRQP